MRCYFIRDNRIEAVEILQSGPDHDMIKQAAELFRQHQEMDHFEVWEGRRLVYRSEPQKAARASN
jgi:hypothetical protein